MDILNHFQEQLAELDIYPGKNKLLIAVSGGLDSVVLTDLCLRAGFPVELAHCNFQLRAAESNRDEAFVQELATKANCRFWSKKFDTQDYAAQNKVSIQVAARTLRYTWFYELLQGSSAFLLTAHHAGDNLETVLMNFFKGTGIAGMRGILPKQGRLLRPLLSFSRETLLNYARWRQLEWVEDSSNRSDAYTRNYFRHQLLPVLQQVYPAAEANALTSIRHLRDAELLYQQSIARLKKKLLHLKGEEWHIPVLLLSRQEAKQTILYELLKEFGFSAAQSATAMSLLTSETGKWIQSPTHRLIRNRKWLVLAPNRTDASGIRVIDAGETELQHAGFRMRIAAVQKIPDQPDPDRWQALLNADALQFPLLLRQWKPGDYFYPLGMKKKKKLARFFIDQKLSKTAKEAVWVLESEKRIVWVIGYRIDDRFKLEPATQNLLQISVQNE